ncbi:polysialic acid transport ATP-binding protein; KpsT [unidentified eubacterium SCB49]|nr:polysialic acid transport ATP-binding protein; KpsT [unidentified eubacterium SCB49]
MKKEKDILVEVQGLSKKFCKDLKKSLWYGVKDLFSGIGGNKKERTLRPDEFWAVKDISFTLRRGECLGLIGHNGAGKSTLLKILNGLINPDEGTVKMYGRVGALIELGAGFNPILSGRENIYNNGAVLGFSKKEIDAKLDEIIDFAEIRAFIDMPVQNYSSGMKVRLGFAVAAQMEPDILIIDEVLAVGDVGFRAKCYERISELMKTSAIIFVSHSMPQISKICNQAIHLNKGKIVVNSDVGSVIESYYEGNSTTTDMNTIYSKYCSLISFEVQSNSITNFEENFEISIKLNSEINLIDVVLDIVIASRELVPIAQINNNILQRKITLNKGVNEFKINIDHLGLNVGVYTFSCNLTDKSTGQQYLWIQNIPGFKVVGQTVGHCPIILSGEILEKNKNHA